ncbi:hypothetical protein DMH04_38950 [Kibdelosporangium aridum]|uniref:Uncharacterized protein n=1 Tax=Kibdelosporangium aridum TaxID=2030 RepID=A0A428YXW3_KIBAR|nr:hypothetical protein [Kibdelosporangium aridum]RSM75130.1 hypothetical protein DMH04_38950 [Kibdelosporangium aridum]
MTKRIASVLTAAAAMGTLFTINAGTAHADVKAYCNASFCIAADIYDGSGGVKRVADATVSVRDGDPLRLKIFIASDSWTAPTPRVRYKVAMNKNYRDGTLVCGSAVGATNHACIRV